MKAAKQRQHSPVTGCARHMAVAISDSDIFEEFHYGLINRGYGVIYFPDKYCGIYLYGIRAAAEFKIDVVQKCVRIAVMPGEEEIQDMLDKYGLEAI